MNNLFVSSAPHIHTKESVSSVMLKVIIALLPATLWGIYLFGLPALTVMVTSVASCVLFEHLFCMVTKKASTIGDLSAVVTGILIGMNMPPTIPIYMVVIGSAFGIIIAKCLYGGLGKNFINPALAARCFMIIAWAGPMTTFSAPFSNSFDAVSSATPLTVMKGAEGVLPSLRDVILGFTGGTIGEICTIGLILGFIFLLITKVIKADISLSMIITFAILTFFFGNNTTDLSQTEYTLMQICSGGLLLAAFFMATDYVTTPTTFKGHLIFGFGCGLLTFVIRRFGGYPEGASFAILLMNVASPLIENYTIPKPFGYVRKENSDE